MKISSDSSESRQRLSDRIRWARRNASLTQSALAREVGVTPSAAAQWEHPRGTKPDLARLQKIAITTRVRFEWLATGQGDKRRRRSADDGEVPALRLDVFAEDRTEEILLESFRSISPRARQMLAGLLEELMSHDPHTRQY